VGINLLREGLDMPEVSLVAILDADKEGFLRSEGSLIQTIGRAARNARGKAILYGDNITGSMKRAMDETARRREKQVAHNEKHGIQPKTITKSVADIMEASVPGGSAIARKYRLAAEEGADYEVIDPIKAAREIKKIEKEMYALARDLKFEEAAKLRDRLRRLQGKSFEA